MNTKDLQKLLESADITEPEGDALVLLGKIRAIQLLLTRLETELIEGLENV